MTLVSTYANWFPIYDIQESFHAMLSACTEGTVFNINSSSSKNKYKDLRNTIKPIHLTILTRTHLLPDCSIFSPRVSHKIIKITAEDFVKFCKHQQRILYYEHSTFKVTAESDQLDSLSVVSSIRGRTSLIRQKDGSADDDNLHSLYLKLHLPRHLVL